MNTNEENEELSGAAFEYLAEWMKKNISPEARAETSADPLKDIREYMEASKRRPVDVSGKSYSNVPNPSPGQNLKRLYESLISLENDVKDYYTGPPVIIIGSGMSGKSIAIAAHLAGYSCGPHQAEIGNLESAKDRFHYITGQELTDEFLIPLKTIASYTNTNLVTLIDDLTGLKLREMNDFPITEKPDFSKLADMGITHKCENFANNYNTHKKVEHFENKTLGAKIGGRKHKKNPFNFRR